MILFQVMLSAPGFLAPLTQGATAVGMVSWWLMGTVLTLAMALAMAELMHAHSFFVLFWFYSRWHRPYPTSLPGMPIWVRDLGSAVFPMPRCSLLLAPFSV